MALAVQQLTATRISSVGGLRRQLFKQWRLLTPQGLRPYVNRLLALLRQLRGTHGEPVVTGRHQLMYVSFYDSVSHGPHVPPSLSHSLPLVDSSTEQQPTTHM